MSLGNACDINSIVVEKKGMFKPFGCRNATGIPGAYGQFVFMSALRLRIGRQL